MTARRVAAAAAWLVASAAVSEARAATIYTDTSDVQACVTRGGATFAATSGGVVMTRDGKVVRTLTALDGLPDTRAWAMADVGSSVWVGTDRGAAEISAEGAATGRTALDTPVRALAVVGGDLVAGTFGRGVVRIATTTLATSFVTIPDSRVVSLAAHGTTVYAGTMSGVFALAAPGGQAARVTSEPAFGLTADASGAHASLTKAPACSVPSSGMPSNDVSAIAAIDRGAMVGTFDAGLAIIEDGTIRIVGGVDKRIDAIAVEPSGTAWIGTARGLFTIDRGATRGRSTDAVGADEVHALAPLAGGGVIAGTNHGAAIIRAGKVTRIGVKDGLLATSVTSVMESNGALFLGTTGGLFIGQPGRFVRLSMASGHVPDDWITALATSGDAIYAGTYNAGVVRLTRRGDSWHTDKLGGAYVNPAGIAIHDGTLFVATMDGLFTRPVAGDGPLALRERAALGKDVTGVAFGGGGSWIASRRGVVGP